MVNIIKKLVPESKYGIKCPYSMTPTRIVVHNTANDATARNEIAYMTNNNYETSFHYAVDDKEIVQGLPLDRMVGTVRMEMAKEIERYSNRNLLF